MTTARILIVDDDPCMLELACCLLRNNGKYEVLVAASPRWALQLLKVDPHIDVIVSDVEMPEMRGPELLGKVAEISPDTAGLLISGHAKKDVLPLCVPFLQKTFIDELPYVVESILSKTREARANVTASIEKLWSCAASLSNVVPRYRNQCANHGSQGSRRKKRLGGPANSENSRISENSQTVKTSRSPNVS